MKTLALHIQNTILKGMRTISRMILRSTQNNHKNISVGSRSRWGAATRTLRSRTTRLGIFIVLILILAPIFYLSMKYQPATEAAWFDDSYAYRKQITFTNSSNAIYSARKVLVEVDTATLITDGKMQSSCQDARFTNQNGKVLRYFIDSDAGDCNTASTDFYVEVQQVHSAPNVLYFYYGNPAASSGASNEFFAPSGTLSGIGNALKGYWSLEETSGTRYDKAHTNELSDNNTVVGTSAGDNTTVADFETSNSEHLNISDNTDLSTGDVDFVMTSWVKFESKPSSKAGIIDKINTGNSNYEYALYYDTVEDRFEFTVDPDGINGSGSTVVSTAGSANLNQWYFVIAWHDASVDTINVQVNNGTVDSKSYSSGVYDGESDFRIGTFNTIRYFNGNIANVGFWKRTLSAEERAWLYNSGVGRNYDDLNSNLPPGDSFQAGITQDLKAYWNLDETSGTRSDSHGSNDLSDNNTVGSISGKIGGAGDVEADNTEYLHITDNADLSIGGSDFTVSTWVKLESKSPVSTIVARRLSSTSGEYTIVYDSGFDRFIFFPMPSAGGNGTIIRADNFGSPSTDTWYHITAWWDESEQTGYISVNDGTANSTDVGFGIGDTGADFRLGSQLTTPTSFMDGAIDNTLFWKRTLTADERTALYNNGNGVDFGTVTYTPDSGPTLASEEQAPEPAAYWKFNEAQGTTANDSTSNNNDGTINGATWTEDSRCISGPCLEFDGSDDYVDVSDDASLDLNSKDISLSAWVRSNGEDIHQFIMEKGGSTDVNYNLRIHTDNTARMTIYQSNNFAHCDIIGEGPTLTDNQWHYLVGTYTQDTNCKIYVDGVLVGTDSSLSGSAETDLAGTLTIGSRSGESLFFDGFIDEVKIYPYARSAAEIKNDYLKGAASAGSGAVLGAHNTANLSDGLVGYWKMDDSGIDAEGESITDSSGNGNSGTLFGDNGVGDNGTGMDCTAAGKYGTGCDFDGTDDYITCTDASCGDSSGLDFATDVVTVSTWINISDNNGFQSLVSKYGSGSDGAYRLYANTGGSTKTLNLQIYTSSAVIGTSSSADFTFDTWQHVVGVYDGSEIRMYINGEQSGTAATQTGNINDSTEDFFIGKTFGDNYYVDGTIDETRIYNRALSPAEVRQLYNFAPGPVAHWKMDDGVSGSGATITDASSNGNNGTTAGSNIDCTKPGKFGKSCEFDGTDDYVSVGDSSTISPSNAITVSAWTKTSSTSQQGCIVAKQHGTSTDNSYALYANSGKMTMCVGGDGSCNDASVDPNNLSSGTWSHYLGIFDGNNTYLYKNGVQIDSDASGISSITYDDNPIHLGADSNDTSDAPDTCYFNGQIDDVRIYNYALTQKQITSVMNGRSVNDPAVGSPVGHAIGEWNFDEQQGQTANDTGLGGNNGTLGASTSVASDDPTWKTSVDCKVGGCLDFDGGDFVEIAHDTAHWIDTSGTVSAWVKTTSSESDYIIDKFNNSGSGDDTGTPRGYVLRIDSGNAKFTIGDGSSSNTATSSNTINDDSWHHIIGTYDGSTISIYVDGILRGTQASTKTPTQTTEPLSIGGENETSQSFLNGQIDEVRIYNYALTEDEVKLEYNLGASQVLGHETGATDTGPAADDAGNPPVATWQMEEGSGSSINDTSGNGNTGTITGATWSKPCYGGSNCLSFDGSDDYVDAGSDSSLDLTTGSISFWLKLDSYSSDHQSIISKEVSGNSDGDGQVLIRESDDGTFPNKINWQLQDGVDVYNIYSDSEATLDTWTHVTVTFGSGGMAMYVNGQIQSDTDSYTGGWNNSSNNLIFGNNFVGGSFYLDGQIDQVKIYDRALSQKEIAYEYNGGAPIAHWKFDECSGTTVHSTNFRGGQPVHDATLNGTITAGGSGTNTSAGSCSSGNGDEMWDNGSVGKYNGSLDFDGTDDYVGIDDSNELDFGTNDFTLSAWVNSDDIEAFGQQHQTIMCKQNPENSGEWCFQILHANSGRKVNFRTNATNIVNSNTQLSNNTWYHATVTRTGSTVSLYINGKLEVTGSDSSSLTNSENLRIGYRNSLYNANFDGQIDDVRIYNYALSADEVKKLYNNSSAVYFE